MMGILLLDDSKSSSFLVEMMFIMPETRVVRPLWSCLDFGGLDSDVSILNLDTDNNFTRDLGFWFGHPSYL